MIDDLLKKCRKMSHTSLEYVDEEDLEDISCFHESDTCSIYYREEGERIHVYWGTDSETELIEGIKSLMDRNMGENLYIEFVPDSLVNSLKGIGFELYSEFADFWNPELAEKTEKTDNSRNILREAQAAEFHLLAEITQKCKGQSRGFDGETVESIEEWLNTDKSTVLVAEHEGFVIGVALVSLYGFNSVKGTVLWIRLLAVTPEYQRRGIGMKLLSFAMDWGVKSGAVRAFLHADIHNDNAIKLYREKGFEMNGETTQVNMMYKG